MIRSASFFARNVLCSREMHTLMMKFTNDGWVQNFPSLLVAFLTKRKTESFSILSNLKLYNFLLFFTSLEQQKKSINEFWDKKGLTGSLSNEIFAGHRVHWPLKCAFSLPTSTQVSWQNIQKWGEHKNERCTVYCNLKISHRRNIFSFFDFF